jgi:tetratricopeptide (TPR) repeat protein
MMAPLCFILMPFGRKPEPTGAMIDFDLVYAELIAPAVSAAGLEPLRADEETIGGIIHKPMFERLMLCPYAVADLTLANANVFYELGVRHALRPSSTVPVIARTNRLPFDVQMLRTVPYDLGSDGAPDPAKLEDAKASITAMLVAADKGVKDSPLFQLLDYVPPQLAHEKTDTFRDQVAYSTEMKDELAAARATRTADAVRAIEQKLGKIANEESGIVIDLYLSYRAVSAWNDMVALVDKMAPPLAATVLVREQLGFALNRLGRRDQAERVLNQLVEERGASSETLGLLGRVYKDRWDDANKAGDSVATDGYLDEAIETYLRGFEADWRDAFPGVNAVTLMEVRNPPDPRRQQILPIVKYAVERKIARGQPDYWDYATALELAILATDEAEARKTLQNAVTKIREPWEPKTTARNLSLIRTAREARGTAPAWATKMEEELLKRAG